MRPIPPALGHRLDALAAAEGLRPIDLALARMLAGIDYDDGADLARATVVAHSAALVSQVRRDGHTAVLLADAAGQAVTDGGPRLPALAAWTAALAASPVVGAPGDTAPLVTDGMRLALGRFWNAERRLADAVRRRAAADVPERPTEAVRAAFHALFPEAAAEPDRQAVAALAALSRRLLLVAGGPGTGKTYTATRILALLLAEGVLPRDGGRPLSVALAAPTAKAAQRLGASLRDGLGGLPPDLAAPLQRALDAREPSTLHRLLDLNPALGFGHTAQNPLPHDLVLVDEGSMVDLMLFDALLAALRPGARLIVLGDPDQLASVEAGAVFGDLCDAGRGDAPPAFARFCAALGVAGVPAGDGADPLAGLVVTLTRTRRFLDTSGVGRLAGAVLRGDAPAAVEALRDDPDLSLTEDHPARAALDWVAPHVRRVLRAPTPEQALAALDTFRLLAVVRRGPRGVEGLNAAIEEHIRQTGLARWNPYAAPFYNGRPVLVTANDAEQRLWNGEVGVCWREAGQMRVHFGAGRAVALGRMPPHEPAWAMTVHKSQGSEFEAVGVALPEGGTRGAAMLARDLLYTAATRAKREVAVFGPAALVEQAVRARPRRISGLSDALRAAEGPAPPR